MIAPIVEVLLAVSALLIGAAAIIGVTRIVRGPSSLDRVVAADLIVAVVIAGLGLWTAWTGQYGVIMFLLLLSILGFTGAASIARLVGDRVAHGTRTSDDTEELP